ncbi:MYXO-CTERM sorting domain-containing protein [Nannocystis sp. ILAH1]|uniref:MYXO-CTERM sorting domain-containing protein n=1 Tax=Nannocystis sp. ILAH1 TaxID=2996789 RepID=UPI00226F0EF6|nr:MYXO-CTERM sorting domain-containing protein [Nannocystis sp. ILAH1]MCY0990311.1 MYXO-CTERM sorting domain-containing protein [Nannocystis sp. ILAH1]
MVHALGLALALFAPAATTTGVIQAEDEPAWGTSPTMGPVTDTAASSTTDDTSTGTTGATANDTAGDTAGDTATMPPVYEACGCSSGGEAGGWAALALLFTAGSRCRRRRPTTSRSCCRAA